jgi:DNA polymerase III subunit epsilon
MGFYIRKTVKAGPFRFNVSKSGIGVSAGIPGFRVGTGPRGNYVSAGRHGFYYRTSLGGAPTGRWPWASGNPQPGRPYRGTTQPYRPSDTVMENVTGATVLSLEPTAQGDLVDQLNTAAARLTARFTWLWWLVGSVIFLLGLSLGFPWALLIWVVGGVGCTWWYFNDQAQRTVVLFYDLQGARAGWFASLVTGWDQLSSCQRLNRVVRKGAVNTTYQFKTSGGADHIQDQISLAATLDGPNPLSSNIAVPSLVAGNAGLYFLPDRILIRYGNEYSDLKYQDVRVSNYELRLRESASSVPPDAVQVGQTWLYVNVKGGPDRRYANNPLLSIVLYGVLELSSPQGLRWEVNTSRSDAARSIAAILSNVATSFTHECKVPELGRVVVGERWTCPECGREWAGAAWPDGMKRGGTSAREWERTEELRRRAEQQDQAYQAGDERGLYGDYPPASLDE